MGGVDGRQGLGVGVLGGLGAMGLERGGYYLGMAYAGRVYQESFGI
jgi:hypothetical protein